MGRKRKGAPNKKIVSSQSDQQHISEIDKSKNRGRNSPNNNAQKGQQQEGIQMNKEDKAVAEITAAVERKRKDGSQCTDISNAFNILENYLKPNATDIQSIIQTVRLSKTDVDQLIKRNFFNYFFFYGLGREWILILDTGIKHKINKSIHKDSLWCVLFMNRDIKQQALQAEFKIYVNGKMAESSPGEFLFTTNNCSPHNRIFGVNGTESTSEPIMITIVLSSSDTRMHNIWCPEAVSCDSSWKSLHRKSKHDQGDVVLELEGKRIHLHKEVLKKKAPVLYNFCDTETDDLQLITVPLFEVCGINSAMFKKVVQFFYLGGEMHMDGKEDGTKIAHLAHYCDSRDLKIYAESFLVKNCVSKANAIDLLKASDKYYLPRLKESCVDFIRKEMDNEWGDYYLEVSNKLLGNFKLGHDILFHKDFTKKIAISGDNGMRTPPSSKKEYITCLIKRITVSSIQQQLREVNLDTDGDRTILEKRLIEHINDA